MLFQGLALSSKLKAQSSKLKANNQRRAESEERRAESFVGWALPTKNKPFNL